MSSLKHLKRDLKKESERRKAGVPDSKIENLTKAL